MKRQYFRKKDPAVQGDRVEWIKMSHSQFYQFITSPDGRDRFFIRMGDIVIEASKEVYIGWRREQERVNYHAKQSRKTGITIVSLYSNDIAVQGNGEDIISDTNVDVEEDVIQIMEVDALYAAISQLDPVSRYIVHSYYLASEQKSEQEIAEVLGISQPAVNKRKNKVLKKLKKLVIKDRKNLQ